jgi:ubiquinone/menaquinone biosynthesis C-methylase UbiE
VPVGENTFVQVAQSLLNVSGESSKQQVYKRSNMMGNAVNHLPAEKEISYPRFATFHTWMTDRRLVRRWTDPLRREIVSQAQGIMLEVGAGGGQNFPFYDADRVVRVEATEPDEAMLVIARQRLPGAPVPITLTRTPVEALPFPDAHFDSVVATLVFCSVRDPMRGLREIWRVLKPGGQFLLLEHVRAQGKRAAWVQDALVPVTTRLTGNCHWNRDTRQAVLSTGFLLTQERLVRGGLQPVRVLTASRPQIDDEVQRDQP